MKKDISLYMEEDFDPLIDKPFLASIITGMSTGLFIENTYLIKESYMTLCNYLGENVNSICEFLINYCY